MATLLLRLSAPMQSWGDESKYNIRQTRQEPTKSGVIGLLAAALGLRRDSEQIPILHQELRMGVRVDAPGRIMADYHTALPQKLDSKGEIIFRPNGYPEMEKNTNITTRYYLFDACFLVGLESADEKLLQSLSHALQMPAFPLFLGRRACPPVPPLCLGIRADSLRTALINEPWQISDWMRRGRNSARLRMILETPRGEAAWHTLRDAPVSFSPVHRRYAPRGVQREEWILLGDSLHDPFKELYPERAETEEEF